MAEKYVLDSNLIWLEREKVGTPPTWAPGTAYKLGDLVVPTAPAPEIADKMYQVVAFRRAVATEPVWPTVLGNSVVSGKVQLTCRDPEASPAPLALNEYYLIDEQVTV